MTINFGEYLYGGDLEAEAALAEYQFSNPSTYIPESTMEKFNEEVWESEPDEKKHSDPIMGWHGFEFGDDKTQLFIGPLPGRKSICLYAIDDDGVSVLAFFKTKEKAEKALSLLDRLADSFCITTFGE